MLVFFSRLTPILFLLVSLSFVAASAHAQVEAAPATVDPRPAAEPAEYRVTIREALAEYTAKNFPEARALFAEAHRLYPNARTLRGLGMTAFELRSYRESIDFLQQALASQVKPLEGGLRAETERLLKRAERFIGRVQVVLTPANAKILVDGSEIDRHGDEPVILEVGPHTLEFQAEGYLPETRTIEIHGRESETWNIVLSAVPPPPPPPTPREVAESAPQPERDQVVTEPAPRPARPLRKNPWLWTGVGAAVVAGIVTGAVLAARDPGVAGAQRGENTPEGGVFSALQESP